MPTAYEPVIGLEVHVQLKTKSKMFARAPYAYGAEPNTQTDPVVLALPGVLPVLNREAIAKSIQVGLLFDCDIADVCKWDRKNYFYPDNPKNYQISQYDQPLCLNGAVEIELPGPSRNIMGEHRKVRLTRIHLEEDVGKLTHLGEDSIVDYNRAGAPLIEIVSEPDMFSSEEAFAFLTALRNAIVAAGMSDCDMEKGQMRCDANVSVRPVGSQTLGTKVEIKNLNSISGVKNGIDYEIKRQIQILESGEGQIVQETRRWSAEKSITVSMRSKEMAHDYRYFPDPDLMPVQVSEEWKNELRQNLVELPFDRQRRYYEQFDLHYTQTSVLCHDRELAEYFEAAVAPVPDQAKAVANWICNDLLRELGAAEGDGRLPLSASKVLPGHITELVKLIAEGTISSQIAKEVFLEMFQSGELPSAVVERKGLKQSSDTGEIEALCREAIAGNPKAVEQYRSGKVTAINALKGPVMKATKGKANPQVLDEILQKLLNE